VLGDDLLGDRAMPRGDEATTTPVAFTLARRRMGRWAYLAGFAAIVTGC